MVKCEVAERNVNDMNHLKVRTACSRTRVLPTGPLGFSRCIALHGLFSCVPSQDYEWRCVPHSQILDESGLTNAS